jgi:hypothetical protein
MICLSWASRWPRAAIFGRAGIALARSTLGARMGVFGLRLPPLVDALTAHLLT